jgi:hypothetical protein
VQSGCAAANNYCGTGIAGINGGSLSQYVNAGDAVLRGLSAGGHGGGAVSLTGGFTYTDAHLTSSRYTTPSAGVIPDPTYQQLGQVPEWTATAALQWRVTRRLSLNATVKSFLLLEHHLAHAAQRWRHDRRSGRLVAGVKGLELYASAQNLTNVHYLDQGYGVTTTNGSTVRGSTVRAGDAVLGHLRPARAYLRGRAMTSSFGLRMVWRWHFYAGLLVVPLVVVLSLSGALFLFKPQVERWEERAFQHLPTPMLRRPRCRWRQRGRLPRPSPITACPKRAGDAAMLHLALPGQR